jgi:hypothetical protein
LDGTVTTVVMTPLASEFVVAVAGTALAAVKVTVTRDDGEKPLPVTVTGCVTP